jgi:hypothetical protein
MKPVTIFSFGYHGWGTCTQKLVHLVDAIEEERGFQRPIFVDTRIRRAGRAPGFQGIRSPAYWERTGING